MKCHIKKKNIYTYVMTGYVIIVRILSIWCRYNNKLYFGGKRGVTAICACVVFLRGIYRAAVDVGATARQTVSCSRRDDQLIRTVNKAPARARARAVQGNRHSIVPRHPMSRATPPRDRTGSIGGVPPHRDHCLLAAAAAHSSAVAR